MEEERIDNLGLENNDEYIKEVESPDLNYNNAVSFIKSKLTENLSVLQFLSESKSKVCNQRSQEILLKCDICAPSVWSALFLNNLKDIIQTRYLIEDSLILLQKYLLRIVDVDKTVSHQTQQENKTEATFVFDKDDNLKEFKHSALQNIYKILINSLHKFSFIEQFLTRCIECEKDILKLFKIDDDLKDKQTDKTKYEDECKEEISTLDDFLDESYCEVKIKSEDLTTEIDEVKIEEFDLKDVDYEDELEKERKIFKKNIKLKKKQKSDKKEKKEKVLVENLNCEECGRTFLNRGHLIMHQRTHQGNVKYKCAICGKGYQYKKMYQQHIEKHTSEPRKFNCDQCGQLFKDERNLKAHIKKHAGEYEFKCEICEKCYMFKYQFELHMQKHAGVRPYRCHVCAAGFAQKNVLDDHIRIHTGEKPFKCEQCPLQFSQRSNLKTHMTIHTGERPFKCDTCSKAFRSKEGWKNHQTVHTGISAYKCNHCSKAYRKKATLVKHVRKSHTDMTITTQTN